jgi:hypothetical protein
MEGRMKRDGLIVAASLAGALLLALLGYEALRWHDSVAADDARFAASPLSAGLWKHEERLPLAPTRRLLGLSDDLAYRRAVSLYTRSRPGEPTALNPQREALRGNARQVLSALTRTDPEPSRRSQAAMLVALLSLGQGDLFQSAVERLQVLRGGVGNLQIAVALDPDNSEAKRNLELVLTSAGLPPSGASDAGGTSDTGDQAGVGRSGSGY